MMGHVSFSIYTYNTAQMQGVTCTDTSFLHVSLYVVVTLCVSMFSNGRSGVINST